MELDKPFPELGVSMDPRSVPWVDAVVWSDRTVEGRRVYEWIGKDQLVSVSWSSGLLSIRLSTQSFIEKDVMYFLISAPFIAIGKNVPVG